MRLVHSSGFLLLWTFATRYLSFCVHLSVFWPILSHSGSSSHASEAVFWLFHVERSSRGRNKHLHIMQHLKPGKIQVCCEKPAAFHGVLANCLRGYLTRQLAREICALIVCLSSITSTHLHALEWTTCFPTSATTA